MTIHVNASFTDMFSMHQDTSLSNANIGEFSISWKSEEPYVKVTSIRSPDKVLFETLMHWPFITVGYAWSTSYPIVDGNYNAKEWTLYETPHQSIDDIQVTDSEVIFQGFVWGLVTQGNYTLRFYTTESKSQLKFELHVDTMRGIFNRLFLNYWCHPDESFHGFGTQYTYWNMKGLRVPILVAEQGIGRGLQPITSMLNIFGNGAGGDWSTTYAPKPLYITNFNRSLVLENTETMFFDLRDDDSVVIEVWGTSMHGRIIDGDSWLDIVEEITCVTGRMPVPPAWTQQGAVVGLEGGTEEVKKHMDQLIQFGVPLTGVWIQDWVGLRHAYDGDRLVWNWELDTDYYYGWNDLLEEWKKSDVRVLTYVNPFFSSPVNISSGYRHNYYEEGVSKGYFVHDQYGDSYVLHSGSIDFCMVDLSNPDARIWMKDILKNEMIRKSGSSGWMADFGEYLPFDAVLFSGEDAASYHNRYPEEWAKVNEEAIAEASMSDEVLYFMRSAHVKSPGHTAMYWVGDQLVSWDGCDGLKTVVTSCLSSGLGGHTLTHSDIGGYTIEAKGPVGYTRSIELLLRWIELSAFGAALFRSHIGSSTAPFNAQVYDNDITMRHFAVFADIFRLLSSYRGELFRLAHEKGYPLIRPMAMHYPWDSKSWSVKEQFLFGEDFLVAPVMDKGAADRYSTKVKVLIPSHSKWVHLWTGKVVEGGDNGRFISVVAPIGQIPVFYKEGSKAGEDLYIVMESRGYIDMFNIDVSMQPLSSSPDQLCETSDCDRNTDMKHVDKDKFTANFSDHVESDGWASWLGVTEYMVVWEESMVTAVVQNSENALDLSDLP
eukprot:CAMPEP_0185032268 /NCGR_PEP_ID=MMETSP1103-20130426/20220_1 /TAXON_ID=36769 /ORGANISM="Paraphysomonas bandaiensis, Strain Caron Lab Isolate" /LENGTH=825 /DNA_ID=CAMNT_0027568097 /DNA_START=78 /DNA_END=2555 /DNA_ORIENTATION=-